MKPEEDSRCVQFKSLMDEVLSLRAENKWLREWMQRLSDHLACALDLIEGDDPAYNEKLIRRGRALQVPEGERVAYVAPQSAEPVEGGG